MKTFLHAYLNKLRLRWKMVVMVLPLVIIPIFIVGGVVGAIATRQAYLGLTQTSKADLDHMADFTLDLLESHRQQFEVYKQDKKLLINEELATLVSFALKHVESVYNQYRDGHLDLATAKTEAKEALRAVNIGDTGYIYAMTTDGVLQSHPFQEGKSVWDSQDENGRYFIRQMCERAQKSEPDDIMFIIYPWRNEVVGDSSPRQKIVAYRYFRQWDWIIAVGGYIEETWEDLGFEQKSFANLKSNLRKKKVGKTGYIYAMNNQGVLTIHPDLEGESILEAKDSNGKRFIAEMLKNKSGWIRYPWQNIGEKRPRMKVVRYVHFEPWDWVIAVGSYEDEFYHETNKIKGHILSSMLLLPLLVGIIAVVLVFLASRILTEPIRHMIDVIRDVKRGRLRTRMEIESQDELGELAASFNRMADIIQRNQKMEADLAQQGKMASLGVLASGVAHEINNPLGVILGYAGYMEKKIEADSPLAIFVQDIKRESKRCKKIVQDLLSYARTPNPQLEKTDLNELLEQILDFASNHTDMHQVTITKHFNPELPQVEIDGDQIRQVAINLILNAGAAMGSGGHLEVSTRLDENCVIVELRDDGPGIPEEDLEQIFEPFFTTKEKGTGLGLAITRQIIEQHQGKITITSTLNQGTTVTLRLPLDREEFI
ncbi:MAG: histidine kinase [Desulfuromonas sp.]|nr:MAG: histidine kinase [Desulfuromonas sp.]